MLLPSLLPHRSICPVCKADLLFFPAGRELPPDSHISVRSLLPEIPWSPVLRSESFSFVCLPLQASLFLLPMPDFCFPSAPWFLQFHPASDPFDMVSALFLPVLSQSALYKSQSAFQPHTGFRTFLPVLSPHEARPKIPPDSPLLLLPAKMHPVHLPLPK